MKAMTLPSTVGSPSMVPLSVFTCAGMAAKAAVVAKRREAARNLRRRRGMVCLGKNGSIIVTLSNKMHFEIAILSGFAIDVVS